MAEQVLDDMELERERGITIKAHAVRLKYRGRDGTDYILNLIDTPGHVDFSYEVSRSLAACEGALLVVDASQGVEAQTLANTYLAIDNNLTIVPVINKIDLPGAQPDRVKEQIERVIGLETHNALLVSAKHGTGVEEVLEGIVREIPAPPGSRNEPLKALDLRFLVRPLSWGHRPGSRDRRHTQGRHEDPTGLQRGRPTRSSRWGCRRPRWKPVPELSAGEVGFVVANIKTVSDTQIGDTITEDANPTARPLSPASRKSSPWSFPASIPSSPISIRH